MLFQVRRSVQFPWIEWLFHAGVVGLHCPETAGLFTGTGLQPLEGPHMKGPPEIQSSTNLERACEAAAAESWTAGFEDR